MEMLTVLFSLYSVKSGLANTEDQANYKHLLLNDPNVLNLRLINLEKSMQDMVNLTQQQTMQSTIAQLQTQNTNIQSILTKLQSRNTNMQSTITQLETKNTKMQSTITHLQAELIHEKERNSGKMNVFDKIILQD